MTGSHGNSTGPRRTPQPASFDIRVSSLLRKTLTRSGGLAGPTAWHCRRSARRPDSAADQWATCSCRACVSPHKGAARNGGAAANMMTTDIDRDAVAKVYARWAPVYDLVF